MSKNNPTDKSGHSGTDVSQALTERDKKALSEFLDGYFTGRLPKHPRLTRFRKVVIWTLSVIVSTLLLNHAIPPINQAVAAARCAIKYETAPRQIQIPVRLWSPYGSTLTTYKPSLGAFTIQPEPQLLNDEEWFGASLSYTRTCDYSISFVASLTAPLLVSNPGWGYAIGVRGTVVNGWPYGATVQFDPALGGLRTVILPGGANTPGYNAQPFSGVTGSGASNQWVLSVKGDQMYASLNGNDYPPVKLRRYPDGDILFRVWNGRLTVRNLTVTKLPNSFASSISSFISFISLLGELPTWTWFKL